MAAPKSHLTLSVLFTILTVSTCISENPNNDGLNLLKDLIRNGKSEENSFGGEDLLPFRIPNFPHEVGMIGITEPPDSLAKRTVNKFKNMMLNKEAESRVADDPGALSRYYIPRTSPKRGAILNWAIPAANRIRFWSSSYRPQNHPRPSAMD